MPFSVQAERTVSKDAGSTVGRFVATSAVPALPGPAKTFCTRELAASFHASACSLPPDPTTRIFIAAGHPVDPVQQLDQRLGKPLVLQAMDAVLDLVAALRAAAEERLLQQHRPGVDALVARG